MTEMTRRGFLGAVAAGASLALVPVRSEASPEEVVAAIETLFGNREITEGRVTLKVPPISENGYSVPLTVSVDSPMTPEDFVSRIAIFAEENPLPEVARFELGPRAGRAEVQTRFRMGSSQRIRAVAEMSDGSLWGTSTFSIVTLAACVVE